MPGGDGPDHPSRRGAPTAVQPAVGARLVKMWYRIGEVSRLVGVEPHVLRYWETEFRSVRPQKSARGQRVYSRRDVETLMRVRDLLYEQRYTIEGARRRLREREADPRAGGAVSTVRSPRLRERLVELRAEVAAFLDEIGER